MVESPYQHDHHYHHHNRGTKQSLSTLEYNNNNRDTITNHPIPRIPEGFKTARAFDTVDTVLQSTPMNQFNQRTSPGNKASEQASLHQRTDYNRNNGNHTPPAVFIRPTVSTHTSSSSNDHIHNHHNNSSRNVYRQTRNTDVSELFLAEAKAAQAKMDMEWDGNSSLEDSFNSYAAMIDDRPTLASSRQNSSSSNDAVGPIEMESKKRNKKQVIALQVVDDAVQVATPTFSQSRYHYHHPQQKLQQQQQQQHSYHPLPQPHPASQIRRYYNIETDDDDDDDEADEKRHVHTHQSRHYRSHRKPLGLAYTLRKTDSGSTFQSLDGLSHSSPLIRHDSKQKHSKKSSNRNKSNKRKKRSALSTTSSSASFTSTINTSFLKCYPTNAFGDSNRFMCFTTPTCLPIDHIKESFDDYRHRYYASTAYKNHQFTGSSNVTIDSTDDDNSKLVNNNSPSKQREGPELYSPSPSPSRVNVQQQHQQHIRDRHSKSNDDDTPEISTTVVVSSTIKLPPTKKVSKRNVRFAAPLVTKINYRPYTPQSEIAVLYFQEEELEELECDRETVTGDQFECQFDEMALAVHIAYQQINPTDE